MGISERPAEHWIERLGMQAHPEGGYFAEVYRSAESVAAEALPSRYRGARSFATSIYFLLRAGEFSALHRIASDELWHFYHGDPLIVDAIHPDERHESLRLGPDADRGEAFQAVVPAGCWFGAAGAPPPRAGYSLVGCTVAPGFDFQDFELGRRADLIRAFPRRRVLIERLTRA